MSRRTESSETEPAEEAVLPEWVEIIHPSFPEEQPAKVTRDAFLEVHSGNGWVLAGDVPETASGEDADQDETAAADDSSPENSKGGN